MRYWLLTLGLIVWAACSPGRPWAAQEPNFTLGPGDVLEISVWGDETLHKEAIVRPDGMVSFPLIGDVPAQGGTIDQLRTAIKQRINEYVTDAPVSVMLLKLGSQKVFVAGKVNRPGMYVMDGPMRVMQALAMSGGLTPFADSSDISILRDMGSGQKVIPFDYDEVSRGKSVETDIVLNPGDTIVVP